MKSTPWTDIIELEAHLTSAFSSALPGPEAQHLMAPYNRPTGEEAKRAHPNPRQSAVMILVYPGPREPHLVLIRRADYKGVHSGQIGLPGGKAEPDDPNLEFTALRETHEEVGVPAPSIQLFGQLTEVFIPPSGFLVTPYVGTTTGSVSFLPDPVEVQEILEVPLSTLVHPETVKRGLVSVANGQYRIEAPYFDIQGHWVWGATAMILSEFKALIQA